MESLSIGDPWAISAADVLRTMEVAGDSGLDDAEATTRRTRFGANQLRQMPRRSAVGILIDQFRSLIVLLLVAAAVLSLAFQHWHEGAAIFAVLILNGAIGFVTELTAVRSMESLHRLGRVSTTVRRSGDVQSLPADELVPGDIVLLEAGDVVTADLRLIQTSRLQADESSLTGESVPVDKYLDEVPPATPLAERSCMLFKGTAVTRGSAEGVVVTTGMRTELGRISNLVADAVEEQTPLEIQLARLGRALVWLTLGIAVAIAVTGILAGKPVYLMVQTAVALAVAAIPEGLPIVATAALARGMWRMSRRNALVNRLSAVETLGSTTVICTDKTGTLTENRMTATKFALETGDFAIGDTDAKATFLRDGQAIDLQNEPALARALQVGALCNNASLAEGDSGDCKGTGDPLEIALLCVARQAGIEREELLRQWPETGEEAFDAETKMMATIHSEENRFRIAVKGAPEHVIRACSRTSSPTGEKELSEADRQRWLERSQQMAEQGLRVIALAEKDVESARAAPYQELTLLALAGLVDPPRHDVRKAIHNCRAAGLRVVMVTGDQAATARYVAAAVGLGSDEESTVLEGKDLNPSGKWTDAEHQQLRDADILARVDPAQKLNLISLYQDAGEIVAMTGDGVNDAPALKKADIGIAMGMRGTQVAREAADMVLKDDAFATIVVAIAEGRVIFANIRKFAIYLLSCNVSEVMVVALAALGNAPLPILPLQILFLNLVTDVFPALALGAGEGDADGMKRPPRDPAEPVLARRNWLQIAGYGFLITCTVLTAFAIALLGMDLPTEQAVTISFLTLAFSQLWHVFNMRDAGSGFFRNDIVRNPFVWGAVALCTVLLLATVHVPVLRDTLNVRSPGAAGWLLVTGFSLVPLIVGQMLKLRGTRPVHGTIARDADHKPSS